MFWIPVSIFLCFSGLSTVTDGSSSSSNYYKTPICDPDGFYCPNPAGYSCLPRTQRCTTNDASDQCTSKKYENCNYIQTSKKFMIYSHYTWLNLSGRKSNKKPVHEFITYRGLMYEYGDHGTRVQDPSDPNYEYAPGKRQEIPLVSPSDVGMSACTYEQVLPFLDLWPKDAYSVPYHNCQNFAQDLTEYLVDGCRKLPVYRKRSDTELAANCTMSDTNSANTTTMYDSASTNRTSLIIFAAVIIFGLAMW